jgi:RNA polymerase sigma factor (sigma-70 family)
MVYALAMSLVQPSDVDDVVQDAFLRAFRNLDLLADPAKFGIWLRRITFGVAIDHVRAERARRGRPTEGLRREPADDGSDIAEEPTSKDLSALQQLERNEVVERVIAALDRLPAHYRVPLTLYHIDGLSHAKVARALGVPEGTVRSLVARARRKLARLLANAPEVQDMAEETRTTRNAGDVLDDAAAVTPRFLHILNGDSVRGTLEQSDVPGAFVAYAEILHEGPVPRENGSASWRETRARYLAARGYVSYAQALQTAGDWDARVAAFGDYDEVVLWFEHDLFDQLLLVRHLDWFSRRELGRTALSLICIGEFPGVEPFHGLGQLDANQLASLLGTRQPVSPAQLAIGQHAWRAFTSPDPNELDALTRSADAQLLPFLAGALQRFLEEYPAVGTGLPRTERQILEILSEGARSPLELFALAQRREEGAFMGDWTFWYRTRDLAAGRAPLVRAR